MDIFSERQLPTDELIKKNSQGPIIRFKRVTFSLKHFRRHIMRSTNNGESLEHIG
jgi:hypothetical protein